MLTVETGSGNPAADSLVSLDEVRTYGEARGLALPEDDTALEVLIRLSHDYLFYVEPRLQGTRLNAVQALPFPREEVYLEGNLIEYTPIPARVKGLALALIEAQLVRPLLPTTDGKIIKKETVGPIITEYAVDIQTSLPTNPRLAAILAPFLALAARSFQPSVDRG